MDFLKYLEESGKEFESGKRNALPSCKSINEPIAGIFISNESQHLSEWKHDKLDVGEVYSLKTSQEDVITKQFKTIPGIFFKKPKMIILRTSPVLKVGCDNNRTIGLWNKMDKADKEKKLVFCVKRFLVFFLDEDNSILHKYPIQLSARGNFMFNFDVKYNEFVLKMMSLLNKPKQSIYIQSDESDAWFACHCIFQPIFESQIVGIVGKRSNACITTDYFLPSADANKSLFLGDEEFKKCFVSYKKWYEKSFCSTPPVSPIEDDQIVYEELDI